jgi:parallel beta-helix repeat protein
VEVRSLAAREQRIFDFYPLEDRVLLSGEGLDGLDAVEVDADLADALVAEAASAGEADGQVLDLQSTQPASGQDEFSTDSDLADGVQLDLNQRLEVIFIDAGVEDAEILLNDLQQEDPAVQRVVFTLQGDRDGVEQITEQLAGLSGVDAVHIVSHGDGHGIQLGDSRLDVDTAAGYAGQIAAWGGALDADADLLIYGCDLASTADGRALIDSIGALCDCEVAASDDATGAEALGGDWELEYATGIIDTGVAFNVFAQDHWESILATYTVTNTNDSGAGSLRDAIDQANASVGIDDTIIFNIAGGGVHTIALASDLAFITDTVTIDATTEVDYAGTPLIELDGSGITGSTAGFRVVTDNTTIKGFSIFGFGDEGVEIFQDLTYGPTSGSNNLIENNWIGIRADGTTINGVAGHGVLIADLAVSNTVRNNVIAGSGESGVQLGLTGGVGDTHNNVVEGNIIGLGVDGVANVGTANGTGISIVGGSTNNLIGTDGDGFNDIGERNVIGGNLANGVTIDATSSSNTVAGNYVGLAADGSSARGNGADGIWLESSGNTISGNVIVDSGDSGMEIGGGATGNVVQGNFVGTDSTASLGLGNGGSGIVLYGAGTADNLIGGTGAGQGNIVAHSANNGIYLADEVGTGNSLLNNQLFDNGGLGIELVESGPTWGVTANDAGDLDSGANSLQNFPVITEAILEGAVLTISGTLDTDGISTPYRIEFFGTPAGTQDATHGEGRYFLGSTLITTDGSGAGSFADVTLAGIMLAGGDYLTATATKVDDAGQIGISDLAAYGSTSELAANVAITELIGTSTAIWSENGATSLETSDWDGSTFGPEGTSAILGRWRVMQGAEAPTRVEKIIVGVDAGGTVEGQMWDGLSWSALPINPLGTVT